MLIIGSLPPKDDSDDVGFQKDDYYVYLYQTAVLVIKSHEFCKIESGNPEVKYKVQYVEYSYLPISLYCINIDLNKNKFETDVFLNYLNSITESKNNYPKFKSEKFDHIDSPIYTIKPEVSLNYPQTGVNSTFRILGGNHYIVVNNAASNTSYKYKSKSTNFRIALYKHLKAIGEVDDTENGTEPVISNVYRLLHHLCSSRIESIEFLIITDFYKFFRQKDIEGFYLHKNFANFMKGYTNNIEYDYYNIEIHKCNKKGRHKIYYSTYRAERGISYDKMHVMELVLQKIIFDIIGFDAPTRLENLREDFFSVRADFPTSILDGAKSVNYTQHAYVISRYTQRVGKKKRVVYDYNLCIRLIAKYEIYDPRWYFYILISPVKYQRLFHNLMGYEEKGDLYKKNDAILKNIILELMSDSNLNFICNYYNYSMTHQQYILLV